MAFLKANPNNSGLRGRMAGQVYAGGGEDTIVRGYVKPSHADSPAQQEQEARFTRGTQLWASLTDAQRAAWTLAAKSVMTKNPKRIRQRPISGENLLTGLTSKFLQATPNGTAPLWPPTGRFVGDPGLTVSLAPVSGGVEVTLSGANSAGMATEILAARLDAAYRKPTGGYRSQMILAFAAGTAVSVGLAPGPWSIAVQWVEKATGRVAGYRVVGTVTTLAAVRGGLAEDAGDDAMAA